MSEKFSRRWEGREKMLFRTPKPLKPQVNYAINRVELQIQRLNSHIRRCADRDKRLFEQIVQAYENHDITRISVLADELAEIRRQKELLVNAKLALDDISLRLRTLSELGSFVSTVSPLVNNLENIKTRISRILPDVGSDLGQVGTKLSDLATKTSQSSRTELNLDINSEDVQKIMGEAAIVAENQTKMKLPETPPNESDRKETY